MLSSMAFSFEVLIPSNGTTLNQSDEWSYVSEKYERDSITSLVPSLPSPTPVQFSIVCSMEKK